MKHALLFLFILVGVCCSTTEILYEEAADVVQPSPWNCSVVIEAFIQMPDNGKIIKPGTVLLTRDPVTSLVKVRGSGTVIKIEGDVLTILTAKHVVEDSINVFVGRYGITAVGYNPRLSKDTDLAVFQVKDAQLASLMMAAPIADKIPAPGKQLDLVGNALGLGLRYMLSGPMASDESIVINGSEYWLGCYHSYPGCSGGGIWHDGKLVGVVSMVMVARMAGGNITLADLGIFVGPDSILPFLRK